MLYGFFRKMERKQSKESGRVHLDTLVDHRKRLVAFDLEPAMYMRAAQYHAERRLVIVTGILDAPSDRPTTMKVRTLGPDTSVHMSEQSGDHERGFEVATNGSRCAASCAEPHAGLQLRGWLGPPRRRPAAVRKGCRPRLGSTAGRTMGGGPDGGWRHSAGSGAVVALKSRSHRLGATATLIDPTSRSRPAGLDKGAWR